MIEKINIFVIPFLEEGAKVRLMFMDEASFGRISEPSYCWCPAGVRPIVPCHRVREYVYTFGAVDPISGDDCYIIAPNCNTIWTGEFLKVLSSNFEKDYIVLCCDRASWHTTSKLEIPDNIVLFHLPPSTPEMNPIEQIWKEVRKDGFKNTLFKSLNDVINKLSDTLNSLTEEVIKNVCGRSWIVSMFNRK